jgi:hypothetical protein
MLSSVVRAALDLASRSAFCASCSRIRGPTAPPSMTIHAHATAASQPTTDNVAHPRAAEAASPRSASRTRSNVSCPTPASLSHESSLSAPSATAASRASPLTSALQLLAQLRSSVELLRLDGNDCDVRTDLRAQPLRESRAQWPRRRSSAQRPSAGLRLLRRATPVGRPTPYDD